MATNFKFVQAQNFALGGGGAITGATSIVLQKFQTIDGVDLAMTDFGTIGYGTLEPGSGTQEEQISFTGVVQNSNGTATLSGVKSVLFISPYTETSGLSKTHSGGVTFVISNTAGFYDQLLAKNDDATITGKYTFPTGVSNPLVGTSYVAPTGPTMIATKKYVDDVAIQGAPDASTTTKGIAFMSVAPASATGPIGVGSNDPRVPPIDTSTMTTGQVAALLGSTGTPSSANKYIVQNDRTGPTMPSGSMTLYGGASAPSGWLFCDGSAVSRVTYATLFGIISTTYGAGDTTTTFNVPDMRGRVPIGVGTGQGGGTAGTGLPTAGTALTAVARAGWKGAETHILTADELPADRSYITGSGNNDTRNAGSPDNFYGAWSAGGGTAHSIVQPVMGVNFIIKV